MVKSVMDQSSVWSSPSTTSDLSTDFGSLGSVRSLRYCAGPLAAMGGYLTFDQHALHGALARGDGGVGLGDVGHVGVVAEPGVVARHQHAVLREVQVGLQRIGAGVGGGFVGRFCLFRIQPRQAAVADDQRHRTVERAQRRGRGRRGRCGRGAPVPAAAPGMRCRRCRCRPHRRRSRGSHQWPQGLREPGGGPVPGCCCWSCALLERLFGTRSKAAGC
jgi:hypothetical protein